MPNQTPNQKSNLKGTQYEYTRNDELMQSFFDYEMEHNYDNDANCFELRLKEVKSGERSHVYQNTSKAMSVLIPESSTWDTKKLTHIKKEISRQLKRGQKTYRKNWMKLNGKKDYSGLNAVFVNASEAKPAVSVDDTASKIAALIAAGAKNIRTPDGWEVSV